MKNKVAATFIFTLIVVSGLMALYFLPPINIGGTPLRKIDLLSDLRPDVPDVTELMADSDSVFLPPVVKPEFVDSCKSGMTCIEDYSDTDVPSMGAFYEALSKVNSLGRPVRIAYFGDSFIEGDIFTGDLRAMLQTEFGGCGVGYVPITSSVAGFRATVHHKFSGWNSHSTTDSIGFRRALQDVSNHYFIPHHDAWVSLEGTAHYAARLDSCKVSSFYFFSPDSLVLTASVNGREPECFDVEGDSTAIRSVSVKGNIHSVKWRVEHSGAHARCFAATMDPLHGVVVDNFSTRGSSGQQLAQIPLGTLKDYHRLRTYDLIVLQYGLNVASDKVLNYDYYTTAMKKVIDHLKEAFPQTSILIVGVGDRENRSETGELRTMPGVKSLIRYQQKLAADTHVAFWNLFEAMGGEGSMVEMVNSKPSMANYDYTHINFRGGKHLADLLFKSLMYGKEQYEKRKAYEAE